MNCDGRSVDRDSKVIYCSLFIPMHGVALFFCSRVEQPNLLRYVFLYMELLCFFVHV